MMWPLKFHQRPTWRRCGGSCSLAQLCWLPFSALSDAPWAICWVKGVPSAMCNRNWNAKPVRRACRKSLDSQQAPSFGTCTATRLDIRGKSTKFSTNKVKHNLSITFNPVRNKCLQLRINGVFLGNRFGWNFACTNICKMLDFIAKKSFPVS